MVTSQDSFYSQAKSAANPHRSGIFVISPCQEHCPNKNKSLEVLHIASKGKNVQVSKMPDKRPMDADSNALVLAKKPRHEHVEVTEKSKSVS